jgi:deoxyribodipyrimidine photo-lyase
MTATYPGSRRRLTGRLLAVTSVLWLRRDLRLGDHPALHAADADGPVVALFVLDPHLLEPAGAARVAFLYRSLRSLAAELEDKGGRLVLRRGDPVRTVPRVAREAGAESVHISADFAPYGMRRDGAVAEALGDTPLVRTGSPYAVSPGRVRKADGDAFQVFGAFSRAWREHGWPAPAKGIAGRVRWHTDLDGIVVPNDPRLPARLELPDSGEDAALRAWRRYRRATLGEYPEVRDRPDLDRTSRMSVYLKWGAIHPRTMLADLGPGDETFRTELAWREFYAAVLHAWPDSAREYFRPELAGMRYAPARSKAFDAWRDGRTGFPIVDAGMRQLRAQGWMHNRVRMIVASFLVKDLHIEWQHGARHFMRHLVDGDLASNQHGWQWTAGTGTDPAPYFRVFNPVTQGRTFDPDGDYVRRWVPELRAVTGRAVHEPWTLPEQPHGYPDPIVDHAAERKVALERYDQAVRRGAVSGRGSA